MSLTSAPLRPIGGLIALALLAMPLGAQAQRLPKGMATMFALPSDIIAQELAFARLARDKGEAKAFKEYALEQAALLRDGEAMPLPKRDNGLPLQGETQNVWMSCDGSSAATFGRWTKGAKQGWYSAIWQRQKKGAYRLVLQSATTTPTALPKPEWLEAKVAECPARREALPNKEQVEPVTHPLFGETADHSLSWSVNEARELVIGLRIEGKLTEVLRRPLKP
ncbi:hypothetical protein EOE18_01035 [Novosphingobium umbonatum]|uniref:Uncharacterized protein n=1 Tax=Novosphingobium umbonatum TaxID=1908524 RepID=A0A437NCN8_9SPHN|nr:hypothetical protein [Novosphingobium umbonatum]RVU07701.1 hypothetical protein EOE18_01035 [Novosphingobium umbonatum]